jgi:hypothetical protein
MGRSGFAATCLCQFSETGSDTANHMVRKTTREICLYGVGGAKLEVASGVSVELATEEPLTTPLADDPRNPLLRYCI